MFGESGEPGGGIGKERFGCPGDIRDLRLMVEQSETNMTWVWRRYNGQITGGLVIYFFVQAVGLSGDGEAAVAEKSERD
jgi:hypothetical protein